MKYRVTVVREQSGKFDVEAENLEELDQILNNDDEYCLADRVEEWTGYPDDGVWIIYIDELYEDDDDFNQVYRNYKRIVGVAEDDPIVK